MSDIRIERMIEERVSLCVGAQWGRTASIRTKISSTVKWKVIAHVHTICLSVDWLCRFMKLKINYCEILRISECHAQSHYNYIVLSHSMMHVLWFYDACSNLPEPTTLFTCNNIINLDLVTTVHLGSVQTRQRILKEGVKPFTLTVHCRAALSCNQWRRSWRQWRH